MRLVLAGDEVEDGRVLVRGVGELSGPLVEGLNLKENEGVRSAGLARWEGPEGGHARCFAPSLWSRRSCPPAGGR